MIHIINHILNNILTTMINHILIMINHYPLWIILFTKFFRAHFSSLPAFAREFWMGLRSQTAGDLRHGDLTIEMGEMGDLIIKTEFNHVPT